MQKQLNLKQLNKFKTIKSFLLKKHIFRGHRAMTKFANNKATIYVLRIVKLCAKSSANHFRELISFNPWDNLMENILCPFCRSGHSLEILSITFAK